MVCFLSLIFLQLHLFELTVSIPTLKSDLFHAIDNGNRHYDDGWETLTHILRPHYTFIISLLMRRTPFDRQRRENQNNKKH